MGPLMKSEPQEEEVLRYSSVDLELAVPSVQLFVLRPIKNNDEREILEVQCSELVQDFGADLFLIAGYTRETQILLEAKSGSVSVFLLEHRLQPDGSVDVVKNKPRNFDKGLVKWERAER
jgi:hypothetical protein